MELVAVRERHVELEEEAIELRLGQRVRAFHLERVLRREDEERLLEHVRRVADRDAVLVHRLEQRALRLRRGAVDLVGEDDVREDRALAEVELPSRRPACSSMTVVPRMSAGIRSGVNWMRENVSESVSASVRTSIVLPRPGTPSSSAWPPASRQMSTPSTTSLLPTMTLPISSRSAAIFVRNWTTSARTLSGRCRLSHGLPLGSSTSSKRRLLVSRADESAGSSGARRSDSRPESRPC